MQPLRVYLSSTLEDLKDHREAVFRALERAGLLTVRMEAYTASDERPLDLCRRDVAGCDLLVGLYAWRYGYEPPAAHGNPDGLSITHLEYLQAEASGLRKLLFFAHPDTRATWPAAFQDHLTGRGDGGAKLNRFRQHLGTEKTASFFHTQDELCTSVLAAVLRSGLSGRLYNVPPLPAGLVPRAHLVEAIRAGLLGQAGSAALHTCVQGAGGFGKTTLALLACHDARSVDAFPDGMLWTSLGEAPDLLRILGDLHVQVTGEPAAVSGVASLGSALAKALKGRRCLVVVDDVWSADDLEPFLAWQGPRFLVTTRHRALVQSLSTDAWCEVEVDELSVPEAAELLGRGFEVDTPARDALRALAQALGCWPLLLELAAARLREEHRRGRGTLRQCIDFASTLLDRKGVLGFDRRDSQARNAAVARSVDVGLDLAERMQPGGGLSRQAAELSIFPENTPIAMRLLADLWGLDDFDLEEDVLRPLDTLSLVRWDRQSGSVQLHMMVHRALGARLERAPGTSTAVHRRLLQAWGDPLALPHPLAWKWFGWHCVQAGDAARLRALLVDFDWLRARVAATVSPAGDHTATRLADVLSDCALVADDPAVAELRLALILSMYALQFRPDDLAAQLYGRLGGHAHPALAGLAASAHVALQRTGRLVPAIAALTAPGAVVGTQRHAHGHPHDGPLLVAGERRLVVWADTAVELLGVPENLARLARVDVEAVIQQVIPLAADRGILVRTEHAVWHLAAGDELRVRGRVDVAGMTERLTLLPGEQEIVCWCRGDDASLQAWQGTVEPLGALACVGSWTEGPPELHDVPGHRRALVAAEGSAPVLLDLTRRCLALPVSVAAAPGPHQLVVSPSGRAAVWHANDLTEPMTWLDLENGAHRPMLVAGESGFDADDPCQVLAIDPQDERVLIRVGPYSDHLYACLPGAGQVARIGRVPRDHTPWVLWLPTGLRALAWQHGAPMDRATETVDDGGLRLLSEDHQERLLLAMPESRLFYADEGQSVTSPDGNRFLLLTRSRLVMVTLAGDADPFCQAFPNAGAMEATWLPDGRHALLWHPAERGLTLWNVQSACVEATLDGQAPAIIRVRPLADGTRAISCSLDGTVQLWNLARRAPVAQQSRHDGDVVGAVVSRDGRRALTASRDGTCRIWSLPDGCCLHVVRVAHRPAEIERLHLLEDGRRVLVTGNSGAGACLVDLVTGDRCVLAPVSGWDGVHVDWLDDSAEGVLWQPDGDAWMPTPVVALPAWPWMRPADCSDAWNRGLLRIGDDGDLHWLQDSADVCAHLVVRGDAVPVVLLESCAGQHGETVDIVYELGQLDSADGNGALSVSHGRFGGPLNTYLDCGVAVAGGPYVLAWTQGEAPICWSTEPGSAPRRLDGPGGTILAICALPGGQAVLIGYHDGFLRRWDLGLGHMTAQWACGASVTQLVLLADGLHVLAAVHDEVQLHDITAQAAIARHACDAAVTAVAVSADGRCAVVGDQAGFVQVLNLIEPH